MAADPDTSSPNEMTADPDTSNTLTYTQSIPGVMIKHDGPYAQKSKPRTKVSLGLRH